MVTLCCYVVAMWLLCGCYGDAMAVWYRYIAMWLSCGCYVVAMVTLWLHGNAMLTRCTRSDGD